jgi:hypothetical protein
MLTPAKKKAGSTTVVMESHVSFLPRAPRYWCFIMTRSNGQASLLSNCETPPAERRGAWISQTKKKGNAMCFICSALLGHCGGMIDRGAPVWGIHHMPRLELGAGNQSPA